MRIFITGASGYVGSVVTEKALKQRHQVIGLARSERSAEKLKNLGASPLIGTLQDTTLLAKAATDADAVLHLGFVHEFDKPYSELLNIDIEAITAMGRALEGTNKPLVTTSGTGVIAPNPGHEVNEESPTASGVLGSRTQAEIATTNFAKAGVRAIAIRLAPYVFGRGGSYFVPANIQAAAKHGVAGYVDAEAYTTAADVDAAAELYLLAMEKGKAGAVYNCATESLPIKKLVEAIATALGVTSKHVSLDEACKLVDPFTAQFLQLENRVSSAKAKSELGWAPNPKFNVCDDIVKGSYKPMIDQLKQKVEA